ncbi:MAG: acyltransferase [Ruminococcaceae bacterium]|nr:acyltransferase [Oscillospiraceae bacterium]
MSKIVSGGIAVLRGYLKNSFVKLFNFRGFKFGYMPIIEKNVEIQADSGSSCIFGKKVRISRGSRVSVRKNGNFILGNEAGLGVNNIIVCHNDISIGDGTILGPNVLIYDHDHEFNSEHGVEKKKFKTAPIKIGKNCWIGANVTILRGTTIGDNCVVGAGCVLKGKFPSNKLILQKKETTVSDIK